jgi:hypothetical protein
VLYVCVKVLLPLSTALLLGAALWETLVADRGGVPWVDYQPFAAAAWISAPGGNAMLSLITQIGLATLGAGGFAAVLGWIGYSFVTGRNIVQRLTPADPILLNDPAPLHGHPTPHTYPTARPVPKAPTLAAS